MKKYSFFIPKRLPGLNEIIGAAHVRIGKKMFKDSVFKKELTREIAYIIYKYRIPAMEKAKIKIIWIEKNRRRDMDNIDAGRKYILDGIVAAGVLKNDGWNEVEFEKPEFLVDKDRPGVIVELEEVEK